MAIRTHARTAAFMPWESPPLVNTAIPLPLCDPRAMKRWFFNSAIGFGFVCMRKHPQRNRKKRESHISGFTNSPIKYNLRVMLLHAPVHRKFTKKKRIAWTFALCNPLKAMWCVLPTTTPVPHNFVLQINNFRNCKHINCQECGTSCTHTHAHTHAQRMMRWFAAQFIMDRAGYDFISLFGFGFDKIPFEPFALRTLLSHSHLHTQNPCDLCRVVKKIRWYVNVTRFTTFRHIHSLTRTLNAISLTEKN